MVWIFFKSIGTKTHCPLSPSWAPFVSATKDLNGMIWEINITSIGQRLFNSLNLGESYILFICTCISISFFDIQLWKLLHIQPDLPVVHSLQMSIWYFGSINLITFPQNSNIQQISQMEVGPFWIALLKSLQLIWKLVLWVWTDQPCYTFGHY